ncbi:MFS family permease [Streptococcus rupicaprae]|uniref:MFS family permease n=1 Tax=Streptococcus rupicaprae TaxID=759619 RepID=A0ABV2FGS8_9STRE
MKKLLSNKVFMLVFASDMLSNFGDVLYYLALMTYVLDLPDAKIAIALVSVSETLPILTGFLMGYLADRTPDKVKTILYTMAFRTGLYALLGLAMGFRPSLGIALLASGINLLSDLAGQYENSLYTPLSLRIVADEDREVAFSFQRAVASIFSIGFQTAGAMLVSVLSYQAIAWLNSGTFLVCLLTMLFLRPSLARLLAQRPLKIEQRAEGESFLSDLFKSLQTAIRECLALPELRTIMVIVPLINALFSVVPILLTVAINRDPHFVFINPATTLAAVSVAMLVGGVLGSVLGMTVFKGLGILRLIQLATLLVPVLFLSFYLHFLPGFFAVLFLTMILAAGINPKLNALIMNRLPEEKIAMISNGIGTYFHLGTLIFRLLVSALVVAVPLDILLLGFLILGIIVVVYSFFGQALIKKMMA